MAKIKFNTDDVLPYLQQVAGVVNAKSSLPILSDILFTTQIDETTNERKFMLTASDGETWLSIYVEKHEFDENMRFCVNATDILKALANLKGSTIVMELDESTHTIKCSYENGHFSMPYDETNEYPKPNMNMEGACVKSINDTKLLKAIEKAGFATANDELRPVMNGVHFDFLNTCMVAVASDGHKLAKYTDLTITSEEIQPSGFTLPKKPSHTLLTILSSYNYDMDIELKYNDKCVYFACDRFSLITRLIEGRYPNYDAVIPKDNTIETTLDKNAFISALKRVLPMGNASSELVELSFQMGQLTLKTEDIDFSKSAKEDVNCDYASQEMTIGFKGSALLGVLQNIDGDEVKVQLKDATRAGLFKPSKDSDTTTYLSLLMPMLVN
jgi:DNA polymerase III, beta subunit